MSYSFLYVFSLRTINPKSKSGEDPTINCESINETDHRFGMVNLQSGKTHTP